MNLLGNCSGRAFLHQPGVVPGDEHERRLVGPLADRTGSTDAEALNEAAQQVAAVGNIIRNPGRLDPRSRPAAALLPDHRADSRGMLPDPSGLFPTCGHAGAGGMIHGFPKLDPADDAGSC